MSYVIYDPVISEQSVQIWTAFAVDLI